MDSASEFPRSYRQLVGRLRDEMTAILPQLRAEDDALGFVLRRDGLSTRVDRLDEARVVVSWLYQGRLALRTIVALQGNHDDFVADLTGFFCGVPLQALRLGKPYLTAPARPGRERVRSQPYQQTPQRPTVSPMSFREFSSSVDARAREVMGPVAVRGLIVEPDLRATLWLSVAGVARVWSAGENEAAGKLTTRTGTPLRQLGATRLDEIGVETAAQFVARVAAPETTDHRLWG